MSLKRPTILLFGYLPPPYFGPSTAYQALMRSDFPKQFDVIFINLSVVKDVREIERFHPRKLLKMAGFVAREFWCLLTRRVDFVCYPFSLNRNAFLKDSVLIGMARLFRVPTVLWAHGSDLLGFRDRSPRWLQRVIDQTVGHAAAGIVLGERLRYSFERHLPADRIYAVPLGIEPSPVTAPFAKRTDRFTILYLGNLIREKGFLHLLEAAPLILTRHPTARFVFAGAWYSDVERTAAERIIRENNLSEKVEFTGLVAGAAKARVLAEADVFVLPTFHPTEAAPLSLLEAMQAGLPIVTTERGSIPEIVRDGVTGLIAKQSNPADLADKINRIAADPALRTKMGEAGRERFVTFYTNQHYGQRMIAVFEKLAQSRAAGR
jgi:glycosyltransferase involved in cell wall biosynthesis